MLALIGPGGENTRAFIKRIFKADKLLNRLAQAVSMGESLFLWGVFSNR
jgi:hypothetical protein